MKGKLFSTPPFQHLLSREKGFIRNRIQKQWENEWNSGKTNGGHPQRAATSAG